MAELELSKVWISRRKFNQYVSIEDRHYVMDKYSHEDWNYAKEMLNDRARRISKSAIAISKKLELLGHEVFPLVHSVAVKGYRTDWQASFMMYGRNGKFYVFHYPASQIRAKRTILDIQDDVTECNIYITK